MTPPTRVYNVIHEHGLILLTDAKLSRESYKQNSQDKEIPGTPFH